MARIITFLMQWGLRFWILLAGAVLSALFFAEVADDVFQDPAEGDEESLIFDRRLILFFSSLRSPLMNQAMIDLTALGSISVVVTLFVVLASVLAGYRDFRGIAFLSLVLAGAGIFPTLLKAYFGRVRPEEIEHLVRVTDLSFPSGHAFGAAAVYIALAYYSGRYARSWAQEAFFYCLGGLLIFLVGVSRIYLGVHYPTDVLAGISGGAAWGFLVAAAFEGSRPAGHGPHKIT